MLAVLAVASLLVGNLAAIAQTNLKRMLAYSTIAQMGFMLLGLVAGVVNGNTYKRQFAYSASMFYIVTYVLTTLASFGIILLLAREGFESEEITDLAGLNQRSPLYAGVMAVAMFSLAGIPPLVGFYAKLAVLQALIASGQAIYIGAGGVRRDDVADRRVLLPARGQGHVLRRAADRHHRLRAARRAHRADVNGALILVLGMVPGGLMTLCAQGHRRDAGELTRRAAMSQSASVWVVLLVALTAANLPFLSERLLGLVPPAARPKTLAHAAG